MENWMHEFACVPLWMQHWTGRRVILLRKTYRQGGRKQEWGPPAHAGAWEAEGEHRPGSRTRRWSLSHGRTVVRSTTESQKRLQKGNNGKGSGCTGHGSLGVSLPDPRCYGAKPGREPSAALPPEPVSEPAGSERTPSPTHVRVSTAFVWTRKPFYPPNLKIRMES